MIPAVSFFGHDRQILQRLQRRDRYALLLYVSSGAVIVVAGEAAAINLDMADHYGFMPLLLRGVIYLLLTLSLWMLLLRANRRLVIGLMAEKRRNYESILHAYDSALSLKDNYTGGHGRRVAHYTRLIAESIGLPQAEVDSVSEAALLHDLGKIAIPDHILTKPERLTIDEFAVVQNHPAIGAEILQSIPSLRRHASAVRHHHEHFDGSGYPDGLCGAHIPLAARIIAVADAFDALSSDRSYRHGVSADRALDEITQVAGSHFDPKVVAVISRKFARDALFAAHGKMP
ncbi:MAG: HD-GYP domain-containing protein [Gammaproteobacteria bacterium]|uniref:HD-GYP domain-containing protein n=1 Tax=Rhodoferax sp. TaxID=50421 RepID=UPI0017B261DB|nr:HD-GYP domain-containing protein [Rhodoferax sp.]MBU3897645.1 HD-GYP domain-containing protein [Gammaproteobacteria bacterium]MBA3058271.1 HD-GYP domain-containing protein [Rhodoferax sp.]MBU3999450.1 HD-GYP domain-containing protein [Gammaproteobacteria bacterium]MBU4017711.1 HD-GYP domain-containing protein [Gammaproteobacteria bacterium]MBU4081154.1 HD-GYP domain-containing protein [Gammaproteobacteria bacterium]